MTLIKTGDAVILEVIKSESDLVTDKSTRQTLAKAKTLAKKMTTEENESVGLDDSEIQ